MTDEHDDREPAPEVEIDLELEEIRDRCSRLVAEAGDPTEPFGLYVFAASSPDSEIARYVERSVFAEWFGNTDETIAEEYGPYEDATVFICIIDHHRKLPAGEMRFITPSSAGIKTVHDMERVWNVDLESLAREHDLHFDEDGMLDITTIAVMPEYRGNAADGLISLALLAGMCVLLRGWSTRWAVSIMDLVALDRIEQLSGGRYGRFPGVAPRRYLDSPASLPIYVDLESHFSMLADDPFMSEITYGRGLESTVRPADWPAAVFPREARPAGRDSATA